MVILAGELPMWGGVLDDLLHFAGAVIRGLIHGTEYNNIQKFHCRSVISLRDVNGIGGDSLIV